ENVAAEFVGTEPVRLRWDRESRGKTNSGGILRRDPRSEQREDHEDDDQRDSRRRQRVVACISGNPAAERDGVGGQSVKVLVTECAETGGEWPKRAHPRSSRTAANVGATSA